MGQLWSRLFYKEPPDVVIVPPLFEPAGVRGRGAALRSSYQTVFRPKVLQQLFEDYMQPSGGVHARLLLSPPGAEDVCVFARVVSSSEASSSGEPALGAAVALRWTPSPDNQNTFAELRAGGAQGVAARCSVAHAPSGVAAFASGSLAGERLFGLRYGSSRAAFGAAMLDQRGEKSELPLLAWGVIRAGRFTLGAERRPPQPASPFAGRPLASDDAPLAWLQNAGVAAALAYRSNPMRAGAGAASFSAIAELSEGHLVLSVWQHMAVCRKVYNLLEHSSVKGITNYLDLGIRLAAPLAPSGAAAFEMGASWQLNKNVLVKARLGSSSQSVALVFKSWWQYVTLQGAGMHLR
jgi:hypothetical protein